MRIIRVVWKDTRREKPDKQYVYRKVKVIRFKAGWVIDLPSDDNVYKYVHSAYNAIDAHLGGEPQKIGGQKRIEHGIQILGKISDYDKDGETA